MYIRGLTDVSVSLNGKCNYFAFDRTTVEIKVQQLKTRIHKYIS